MKISLSRKRIEVDRRLGISFCPPKFRMMILVEKMASPSISRLLTFQQVAPGRLIELLKRQLSY